MSASIAGRSAASIGLLLTVSLCACAAREIRVRSSSPVDLDRSETDTVSDAPPPSLATREPRTLRIEHVEPAEDGPIDVGPQARRAPRGRRVDVAFREADLANALRFLASAGGIDLVLSGGLVGTVTIELRRVRAYDAIVALAEAHGATVETREGIVVVRGH